MKASTSSVLPLAEPRFDADSLQLSFQDIDAIDSWNFLKMAISILNLES